MNTKSYNAIIGIDALGLVISFIISKILRQNCKLGYLHLEFLIYKKNIRCVLYRFLEVISHKHADFTIGLDKFRTNLLLKKNRVNGKNVLNIANLHYEKAINNKSTIKYLDNQILIMNIGSFSNNTLIVSILDNLYFKKDYIKYVFHGWASTPELEKKILHTAIQHSDNFIFSQNFLPQSEYRKLLERAHIGLAFYNPNSINTRYLGAGSGKLFEYWRHGIPVICHKNTGMEYLVEGKQAGLCIKINEFKSAIDEVISKYEKYSMNAFKAYNKYYDHNNYDDICNKIDKFIAVKEA